MGFNEYCENCGADMALVRGAIAGERAAIAAWLRAPGESTGAPCSIEREARAAAIERGEHLKG